jgi:hypothetical protein
MALPTNSHDDVWVVVVPAAPREEAMRRFARWLAGRGLDGKLDLEADVEVDLYRASADAPKSTTLLRYRVRRAALQAALRRPVRD